MVANDGEPGRSAVSAREQLRATARRVAGIPDAGEVGAALAQLHAEIVELRETVTALRSEQADAATRLAYLEEDVTRLHEVIVEQAGAIEALQGQRSAGPGR